MMVMSFYEKKERRGWLFSSAVDREWERWIIRLTQHEAQTDEQVTVLKDELEKTLNSCLLYITTMASDHREHVPANGRSFYRIKSPGSGEFEGWSGTIKKIIHDTTTASNLIG